MSQRTIGLLIKRKDMSNPIIKDIHKELLFYIFEIQLILLSLEKLETLQLMFFDCKVGDRKCQTRASQLIDLLQNKLIHPSSIQKIKDDLLQQMQQLQNHLLNFNFENLVFTPEIINKFKCPSMSNFMDTHNINITIPKDLIFMTLWFITTNLSKQEFMNLAYNKISNEKIKKFTALAKIELCKLSIEYEQELAQKYMPKNQQKILDQIEYKQFSSVSIAMTPLFPSFKVIFEKMKQNKQNFLTKKIILCSCGGIIKQLYKLYHFSKNKLEEISLKTQPLKEIIMIFEGYSFHSSWTKLKKILNIPQELYPDATSLQKICQCPKKTSQASSIVDIEKIILAGFVQHPQFITDAKIDWKGLKLENSDLKKEFDHLKIVPGCSIDDMSQFCIRHVYTSTIADVLKEKEEMEEKLHSGKNISLKTPKKAF